MRAFPCTGCGCCCRRVGSIEGFPLEVLADGSCSQLQPDNSCAIYETRPDVCRVNGRLAELTMRERGLTWPGWHRLNAELCNRFQEEDGLPASMRVAL